MVVRPLFVAMVMAVTAKGFETDQRMSQVTPSADVSQMTLPPVLWIRHQACAVAL